MSYEPPNRPTVQVVVPIYKPELSPVEEFALDHSLSVLSSHAHSFIAPLGLDVSYYVGRYGGAFRFYSPDFFASTRGYSRLLVSVDFYHGFFPADYVLILQPDVYVFRDELHGWLARGFDYIGAPWPDGVELNVQVGRFEPIGGKIFKAYVGNGGFSLRRRESVIALLEEHAEVARWFEITGSNEDLFFAIMGGLSESFLIPNQMVAAAFALEVRPEHYLSLNGEKLPMAVHAFEKHSPELWRRFMPKWPD